MPTPVLLQGDILNSVMMHLKPRHLLPLMCTNKTVYEKMRDNKEYYARYAMWLLYRYDKYEGEENIYRDMKYLPLGYHATMEAFCGKIMAFIHTKLKVPARNYTKAVLAYNTKAIKNRAEDEEMEEDEEQAVDPDLADRYASNYDLTDPMAVIKGNCELHVEMYLWNSMNLAINDLMIYLEDFSKLSPTEIALVTGSIANLLETEKPEKPDGRLMNVDMGLYIGMGMLLGSKPMAKGYDNLMKLFVEWKTKLTTDAPFAAMNPLARETIIAKFRAIILQVVTDASEKMLNKESLDDIKMVFIKGEAFRQLWLGTGSLL